MSLRATVSAALRAVAICLASRTSRILKPANTPPPMIAAVIVIHTASISGDRSDMRLVRGDDGGRPGSTIIIGDGRGGPDALIGSGPPGPTPARIRSMS